MCRAGGDAGPAESRRALRLAAGPQGSSHVHTRARSLLVTGLEFTVPATLSTPYMLTVFAMEISRIPTK